MSKKSSKKSSSKKQHVGKSAWEDFMDKKKLKEKDRITAKSVWEEYIEAQWDAIKNELKSQGDL